MPVKTETFWTDDQQATERLAGCLVLYDNKPVIINEIEDGKAFYSHKDGAGKAQLSDPKWMRFRTSIPTGWYNVTRGAKYKGGIYIQRVAQRTRSHGLTRNNTKIYDFFDGRGLRSTNVVSFATLIESPLFAQSVAGEYVSSRELYEKIAPGKCVAMCKEYAVYRDEDGLRKLYRRMNCVGLMLDKDSVSLTQRYSYLREEILEKPNLPNLVKEI